jgi:hypothetical protein
MEGVHKLSVPLVADTKVGANWRDMSKGLEAGNPKGEDDEG